jgi:hypothetical protein
MGNRMGKIAKMISAFGYEGVDHLFGTLPMKGRQKSRRVRMNPETKYKPASSYGFRGSPRSSTRCGSVPAPTLDQVRKLEQAYMLRLIVKTGIIYFKSDDTVFDHNSAKARRQEKLQAMIDCCV